MPQTSQISSELGSRIAGLVNDRDVAITMLLSKDAGGHAMYDLKIWRRCYDRAVTSLRELGIPIVA